MKLYLLFAVIFVGQTVGQLPLELVASPSCTTLYVGNNSAQYNLAPIIATFNQAATQFGPSIKTLPIGNINLYYFYTNYFQSLNSIVSVYAASLINATTYINYVLNNLTAATAPTSTNFNNLTASINLTVSYLSSLSQYPNVSMNNVISGIINTFNGLQAQITQIQSLNINMPSGFLLSYIPGTLYATTLIANLTSLANSYFSNVNSTLVYINSTFATLKSSDNNFIAIETQFNNTNASMFINALSMSGSISLSLNNTYNTLNTTVKNFFAGLSPAISSNANIKTFIINTYVNYMNPLFQQIQSFASNLNSSMVQYQSTLSMNMNQFYQFVMSNTNSIRSMGVMQAMMNTTYGACFSAMVTAGNALYIGNGSILPIYQCATNETAVNIRINNTISSLIANFQNDFNTLMQALTICPSLPQVDINSTATTYFTYPFTVVQCFQANQQMIDQLAQELGMVISSLYQLIQQFMQVSSNREQSCFSEYQSYEMSMYGLLYATYQNCTMPALSGVAIG